MTPDPRDNQIAYYEALIASLKALAASFPGAAEQVQPMIEHHRQQITAIEAVEAIAAAPTGEMTMGYQKSATGAMQPRPVRIYGPVGNEHRTRSNLRITTGQQAESRAFWPDVQETYPGGPDIRIDPPYDR